MTFATGTLCKLRAAEEDQMLQTSMALLTAAANAPYSVAQHNKHSVRFLVVNPLDNVGPPLQAWKDVACCLRWWCDDDTQLERGVCR